MRLRGVVRPLPGKGDEEMVKKVSAYPQSASELTGEHFDLVFSRENERSVNILTDSSYEPASSANAKALSRLRRERHDLFNSNKMVMETITNADDKWTFRGKFSLQNPCGASNTTHE